MQKYTKIAETISLIEGLTGAAVWGGGPLAASLLYKREAEKEIDPVKKQKLLNKARQLKIMALGGGIGGALPFGSVIGGPIGATVGYKVAKSKE